jgi:hypothetical protein
MNDGGLIFHFELDFAGTLRCIPMVVRFKLDQCGIKLSLRQWSRFGRQERAELVVRPCGATGEIQSYKHFLIELIETHAGDQVVEMAAPAHPEWDDTTRVPARLVDYASGLGMTPPTLDLWAAMAPLQRFALFKLTRPGHDNDNFGPAMREFGLAR